jgi:TfoX/Sxy family transcriptional regulator of competence genes
MAYDQLLAARIRALIGGRDEVLERRMFGGLAFLMNGHMACGVQGDRLVLRLGIEGATAALREPHTRPMDFTGKPLASMVYVEAAGLRQQADLRRWIGVALRFAKSLPPK